MLDQKTLNIIKEIINQVREVYTQNNKILTIVSLGIAILGLVLSAISFIRTNAYTKGTVEIYIRNMISTARNNQNQIIIQIQNISDDQLKTDLLESSIEDLLNAYDEACAKYNDRKVDKKRFRMLYTTEILDVYKENKDFIKETENFKALEKVYNEFTNKEK